MCVGSGEGESALAEEDFLAAKISPMVITKTADVLCQPEDNSEEKTQYSYCLGECGPKGCMLKLSPLVSCSGMC